MTTSETSDTGTILPVAAPGPVRLRRLRRTPALRELVRETQLAPDDLVLPLFLTDGHARREPVASMPGVERLTADLVAAEALAAFELGIRAVLLFGVPDAKAKDALGIRLRRRGASARRACSRWCPSSSSSPTCACASTPITGTAASSTSAARS